MTKKIVVVTGANGFIGQYCLPLLIQQGFHVHGFSKTKLGTDSTGVIWHQINLLTQPAKDLLLTIRPTHLLHLAWCTAHGLYWTTPENNDWVKVSARLLDDFKSAGGQRFVFSGSCAEYSWGAHCVEGQTIETPATLYGQCKKSFTDQLLRDGERGALSTAIGRVFFLFGPGEPLTRLMPSVMVAQLKGEPVKVSDGKQLRDFMYVSDVAGALVALLASKVQGVVNIASGKPLSVKTLIDQISLLLGPNSLVEFGTVPRSSSDPDVLTAACTRLTEEVSFQPKISITAGLSLTVDWIRSVINK
jgi:nucleoside-diphosphate-sugar epimerase